MPISLRKLPKTVFKRKINQILFEILASEDCYIDLPVIIQKVKLNLFSLLVIPCSLLVVLLQLFLIIISNFVSSLVVLSYCCQFLSL